MFTHIDGLMQDRRNASAFAVELRLSCTNPSISILKQNYSRAVIKAIRYDITNV